MPASELTVPLLARTAPPWTACGDPSAPEFGSVFAGPGANGAAVLTFDRAGRHHALTVFDAHALGSEVIVYGRRFAVVRQPGIQP